MLIFKWINRQPIIQTVFKIVFPLINLRINITIVTKSSGMVYAITLAYTGCGGNEYGKTEHL